MRESKPPFFSCHRDQTANAERYSSRMSEHDSAHSNTESPLAQLGERRGFFHGRAEHARLRRLVDEHWRVVGRLLRHLGVGENDVDDGIQQVFLVAAQKLEAIRHESERAFLMSTAVNIAAQARRARAKAHSREVATEIDHAPDPRRGPEEALEESAAMRTLNDILELMDEDVRSVFVLYEIEELTMAKIAELLALPPGTVASRLRRGRELFRAEAERRRDPEEKQEDVR